MHLDLAQPPVSVADALERPRTCTCDELRLELRLLDLLDVDEDLALGALLDLLLQLVDLGTLAPDDDAGTRGVDVDLQFVGGALDLGALDASGNIALDTTGSITTGTIDALGALTVGGCR